jgi:hypothetical protein
MFRAVFWVILPCKMIVDNPEDNSEHHTRRRENLKSHKSLFTEEELNEYKIICFKRASNKTLQVLQRTESRKTME